MCAAVISDPVVANLTACAGGSVGGPPHERASQTPSPCGASSQYLPPNQNGSGVMFRGHIGTPQLTAKGAQDVAIAAVLR